MPIAPTDHHSASNAMFSMTTETSNPGDDAPAGTEGTGEGICPACGGSGVSDGQRCQTCGGSGKVVEGIGGG